MNERPWATADADIIKNISSERKFVLIDEADYGAWTENSQKVVDYII